MPEPLTQELKKLQKEITKYAVDYGLDLFDTIFEVIDYNEMNMVAAYTGFPTRYPHWHFGMEFEALVKSHSYGLSKIYEMVINTNPAYSYLLKGNDHTTQKLVIAHVLAHVDFFKNNLYFAGTNRKMVDEMANHATLVRRYIDRYGLEAVESWLDVCLSIENLIDYHLPAFTRRPSSSQESSNEQPEIPVPKKIRAKDYMDEFINPKEFLEEQRKSLAETASKEKRFPPEPEKDILLFLAEHAPIEHWERELLNIVRDEAYYFAPQGMTKIMNEGWASYWHSKIMTERAMEGSDVISYAEQNAGVMGTSPGRLNPYKLGVELYRDIEDRWNKGKFGKEYDDCDDLIRLQEWDKELGLGREKIFEVRKIYCDLTFIDTFLTEEFVRAQKLFTFGYNKNTSTYEIQNRQFKKVKESLLLQLTNFGHPFIYVADGNFENRSELLLLHKHENSDLDYEHARDTLANIQRIWRRPVNLETSFNGKKCLISFDGKEYKEKELDQGTLF